MPVQTLPQFWLGSDLYAAMYILPKNTMAHRAARANAITAAMFFVLIPVVPFLIVALWRILHRR